ncbi:hypothetical protein B0H19DRAFT_1259705 [Mycena capillaripes]|nr:hypothetical protein B0H19DRAFT_1259705 [Mycena capillaripes]
MVPANERSTSPRTTTSPTLSRSRHRPVMLSAMKFCAAVFALSGTVAAIANVQATLSGATIIVTWSSDPSDTAPCTIALFRTYNGPFSIANNVNPQANKAVIEMPQVDPGTGYTAALLKEGTNDVLASSSEFSVAPARAAPTTHTSTATVTAKPASKTSTSTHVWLWTESMSMKPISGSGSVLPASGTHSGSAGVPVHSGSSVSRSAAKPTSTAPLSFSLSGTASASVHSASVSALSSIASLASSVHATTSPSASASAHTGAALAVRIPTALAVIMGMAIGMWAM